MAANRVYIQVDFQSREANDAIDNLNKNIKKIGTTTQQSTQQATAGMKGFSVSIAETTRGLDQIGSALAGLGITRGLGVLITAADDIKRTAAAFKTMGANALDAYAAIDEIRAVAKTSPFSFDELREAGQRMRAFGFDLKQIPSLIETVADAAAALGKGKVAIDSITLALGQMKAKGIIQGQEAFRQLAEQSINAVKYLQKGVQEETGKAVSEMDVRKMIEKQMIGAEKGVQLILDGMKKDFGGAGKAIASELTGAQFDKFVDDVKKTGAAIANDFAPAMSKAIAMVREGVAWFGKLPPVLQDSALAFAALTVAITGLGVVAKVGLLSWIPEVIGWFVKLGPVLTTARMAFVLLVESLAGGATSMAAFRLELGLMTSMMPGLVGAIGTLAVVVASVAAGFAGWEAGKWLREKVDPDSWLGKLLNRGQEVQAKKFDKDVRADLELTAKRYQQWMREMKLPEAEKMSNIPFNQQTDTELKDNLRHMRSLLDAEAIAQKARQARLIQESKDNAQHQAEIAEQALDKMKEKQLGGIEAVIYGYRGLLREVAGNAGATAKVRDAIEIAIQLEQKKEMGEYLKGLEELSKGSVKTRTEQYQQYLKDMVKFDEEILKEDKKVQDEHAQYMLDTNQKVLDMNRSRIEYERTALEGERDQRLAELDTVHRQSLDAELAYQDQALAIKIEYAQKIRDIDIQLQQESLDRKLADEWLLYRQKKISYAEYLTWVAVATADSQEHIKEITATTDTAINKERLAAAKASSDAIYDEQKKIYDKLKSSLDRVFDALLDKSTSIWQAMGNALKTAIIGAIKEIVTSRAAAALMQIFGYGTVSFGGGPRGLGGQQPIFGGGGGVAQGGSILGALLGLSRVGSGGGFGSPGAPGGTGGFAGPVATSATGGLYSPVGGASTGTAATSPTGYAGLALGLKGLLGLANAAKFGGGVAGTGMALASSPAAGIIGALLAMTGLKRGGFSGLAMSAGGGLLTGAAIGMLFGGPLGAIMGAFAGLVAGTIAGTIRLFIKNADQKVREKVRSFYGVDIANKDIRNQIVQIAKQKYGGNLDLAISSPEVRELVQLYAITQGGTATKNMPRPMYPATFSQSSAGLSLQPVYSNGQLVSNPYTGTTTSQWAQGNVYVQLNPQQANDLFEGRVVNVINDNPGAISSANAAGTRNGTSRDGQRTALLEPLTVVR